MEQFDLVIIGSGPGGCTAALEAAKRGKKAAVVEKDELGGVCLNRGCIPTKAIISCTKLYSKIKRASDFGLSVKDLSFDWGSIIKRKDEAVGRIRKGLEFSFSKNNIQVIKGIGSVKEKGLVEVQSGDGKLIELKCSNIIIATGTEASKPKGFENAMTSDDALSMKELPKEINIIGAGAVGIEFACIFNALGVKVSVIEMMPQILPGADEEIAKALQQNLTRKGINIQLNLKIDSSLPVPSPQSLVTGRKFEKIPVNNKMQTKDPAVYAIGDVTGTSMYAHSAMMQGIAAVKNICGENAEMDYNAVPSCIFSDPETASVGLTEQEAKEKGLDIKIGKFNFAALGRSTASGEREGFVKLIADAKTGKILGGHIIGNEATNLIQEIVVAVRKGLTAKDIAETIHAHPTLPEAVWEAARELS